MAFELVDKEDARGVIAGSNYGSSVRIMARGPRVVLFNGLGLNSWDRREVGGWHSLKSLFKGRPTIAQYEAVQAQVDGLLGEGVGAAVVEAWRKHKTVLVDGGGEPLPLPNLVITTRMRARFAEQSVTAHLDLTGKIRCCLQCGKPLAPHTNHHRMGHAIQPDHPRTLEDCQRRTNQTVIACHSYGMNHPEKWGYVEWFETWDGETLHDPYFCHGSTCAAKYGRRAAEAGVILEPGIEPARIEHIIRDDVEHFEKPEPTYAETGDGRRIRLT
jgi:hypothetical protein